LAETLRSHSCSRTPIAVANNDGDGDNDRGQAFGLHDHARFEALTHDEADALGRIALPLLCACFRHQLLAAGWDPGGGQLGGRHRRQRQQ